MSEEEIKFRAYLLILNSEFPKYRKTEAMEELLKIYNKLQQGYEELEKQLIEKNIIPLFNEIDKLQADKNKLINYIAIRENKTHEEVCKEFDI